jgi:hypothetical protein
LFSCVSSDFNAENRSDRYTAPYYFDILETFLVTPLSPAANSSLLCAAKLGSLCSSDRAKSAAACGMCGGINLMVLETVGCTKALIQGWCEHGGGGGVADAPASTCDGKIRLVAVATTGSSAEQAAASMLAAFLGQLAANGAATAPPLPIVSPLAAAGKPHVAVGAEAAAALGLPASDLADLGQEGFVLSNNRTAGIRASCGVVLAGASNRSQLTRDPPPGTF